MRTLKRFSDLGITQQDDRKIFNCHQVSIEDILNIEIEVMDFVQDMKTKHGDGRCLIHYVEHESREEGKFFTNSVSLKSALLQVTDEDLPFITTIKATKCGIGKIYQFT